MISVTSLYQHVLQNTSDGHMSLPSKPFMLKKGFKHRSLENAVLKEIRTDVRPPAQNPYQPMTFFNESKALCYIVHT